MHREDDLKWRFWDKRPDGMVLDKEDKVYCVMEFKRAFERYGVHRKKRVKKQNDSMTICYGD